MTDQEKIEFELLRGMVDGLRSEASVMKAAIAFILRHGSVEQFGAVAADLVNFVDGLPDNQKNRAAQSLGTLLSKINEPATPTT